jgi:hypothetical protein
MALERQWHGTCGGYSTAFYILLSQVTFKQIKEDTGCYVC